MIEGFHEDNLKRHNLTHFQFADVKAIITNKTPIHQKSHDLTLLGKRCS